MTKNSSEPWNQCLKQQQQQSIKSCRARRSGDVVGSPLQSWDIKYWLKTLPQTIIGWRAVITSNCSRPSPPAPLDNFIIVPFGLCCAVGNYDDRQMPSSSREVLYLLRAALCRDPYLLPGDNGLRTRERCDVNGLGRQFVANSEAVYREAPHWSSIIYFHSLSLIRNHLQKQFGF